MNKKQIIIIVDDDTKNLSVAAKAAKHFTKASIDVAMTDKAKRAFELINDDKFNVIGVVTDLLFPAEQSFNDGIYSEYINMIEKHAIKEFITDEMLIGCAERVEKQLRLLRFTGDELAYGGGLALECANKRIPFVILSDIHRHVSMGSEYDGATLFVPFYIMGFIKKENLWTEHYSRHVLWHAGMDKKSADTWRHAFEELTAQWYDFRTWTRKCDNYDCNEIQHNSPELDSIWTCPCNPCNRKCRARDKVRHSTSKKKSASVKKMWKLDYHLKADANEAKKIVNEFNKVDSEFSMDKQIDFVKNTMESMREIQERVASVQAKSLICTSATGNIRLPAPYWFKKIFRPDIGVIVGLFNKCIDYELRRGLLDNQQSSEIMVWKINNSEPKSVYYESWWDFRDDLEPPRIADVSKKDIKIESYVDSFTHYRQSTIKI